MRITLLCLSLPFPAKLGLLASLCSVLSAQVPAVRQGSFELGGFVGSTLSLDGYRAMGGGNVSYAVTKYLLPYVEFSFFPGVQRTKTRSITINQNQQGSVPGSFSIPISDFHGGVHVRIPLRESHVVPYLVVGAGGLRTYGGLLTLKFPAAAGGGSVLAMVPSETDPALNFGGGLRYYMGQTYGIRVEAKAYKPFGNNQFGFSDPFSKIEFGFFAQFP